MSDAAGREWRFYLDDMIDFTGKALAYTAGLDRAGFSSDSLRRDATLRNLDLLPLREQLTALRSAIG
jgi:uncharacterized protein with HEPN domain